MTKPVIFCDFDGTITNSDNIIAVMKKYAPPEWEAIKDDILGQNVSIQEGVGRLFSLLPSSSKDTIIHYLTESAVIRDGFKEFVAFTKKNDVTLYIVSGGIDFFVYPLLNGLVEPEQIYCNGSDFSGETIKILWPHSCDDGCQNGCGCCKPSLIRRLASPGDYNIVIGDSITDLQAAKLADHVIARDFLLEKCQQLDLPHTSFTTFYDVIDVVSKQLEVKQP
ncbi:2-hydroxy-3-keto-5-methylthiopentenyl-1-phosphate phosphatase [Bacillus luteolus]|uniref:2-hydroxy-3-keto-5-methylthiopentenyl-1-phosphate phosphatase n=1 Tax=Litchfieldia luteola TaxID=682179 RepID=A0ABR9QLZ8_9BACI|nr:2-hydroxy-3-keto-5-methylthiopentenyl-1-phosphate phosphatase [Cytobacillus luteolus]MBE4909514.1 2-hydroxy-3-keto-5-methylthiopentenyl-1-phosphate phosphatase [Cytobacillus luteolus]MBP1940915.1 2-hydroxy-3-keto-5-methylthiopentenyl-1-phosphate phosphatase [Cytobacillus luteolus]